MLFRSEGTISEVGVRKNIRVAIQYLAAWLSGNGCVPIDNLMEDAATAEIGRSQLWQWVRHNAEMEDGRAVTRAWLDGVFDEENAKLVALAPAAADAINEATALLRGMTSSSELDEFLTLPAYAQLKD